MGKTWNTRSHMEDVDNGRDSSIKCHDVVYVDVRWRRFCESIATRLLVYGAAKFADFAATVVKPVQHERLKCVPCKIFEAFGEINDGCVLWTFGVRLGDAHERLELALELSQPIFSFRSSLKVQSGRRKKSWSSKRRTSHWFQISRTSMSADLSGGKASEAPCTTVNRSLHTDATLSILEGTERGCA